MKRFRAFLFDFANFFDYKTVLVIFFVMINIRMTYDLCYHILTNPVIALVLTSIIYLVLALVYFSMVIEKFMVYSDGGRSICTKKEDEIIWPTWVEANKLVHLNKYVELNIIDNMSIDVYGLPNNISISKGMIDILSKEELRAVFCHELIHIKRRDSQLRFIMAYFVNIYWSILLLMAFFMQKVAVLLGENIISDVLNFLSFLCSIIPKLVVTLIMYLLSFESMSFEYVVDRDVAELGLKDDLIKALYTLYDIYLQSPKKLLEKMLDCHPPIAYRIYELEHLQ